MANDCQLSGNNSETRFRSSYRISSSFYCQTTGNFPGFYLKVLFELELVLIHTWSTQDTRVYEKDVDSIELWMWSIIIAPVAIVNLLFIQQYTIYCYIHIYIYIKLKLASGIDWKPDSTLNSQLSTGIWVRRHVYYGRVLWTMISVSNMQEGHVCC